MASLAPNPYESLRPPKPERAPKAEGEQPKRPKKKPAKKPQGEAEGGAAAHAGENGHAEAGEEIKASAGLGPTLPGAWKTSRNKVVVRKEKRVINAAEAQAEIEDQIASSGWQNPVHRSSLLRQWRRFMEEPDTATKYVDEEHKDLTFADVFVRSSALEAIVAAALQQPFYDDSVLTHIFSHCMEGDFAFFKRLADGLKLVSIVFKDVQQEIPQNVVDNFCAVVSAIKVCPHLQKARSDKIREIDSKIAYRFQRLEEGKETSSTKAVEERNKFTAELLSLAVEKQQLLRGNQDRSRNADVIAPLLDEVVEQINGLVQFGELQRDVALEKVKEFETQRSKAMKGQDGSITKVIEQREGFDREEASLRDQLRDLERQMATVNANIQKVQQQRRDHAKEYSKVMGVYQEWLGSFQGEDEAVRNAFQYAETALTKREEARDFTLNLGNRVKEMLSGKSSRHEHQKQLATKQFLTLLDTHLASLRDTMDLVARRVRFCNGKLATMKEELREARELRMTDVATDLSAGINKFEAMHAEARTQMEQTATDVENIQTVLESFAAMDEDPAMAALRVRAQATLAEIVRSRGNISE